MIATFRGFPQGGAATTGIRQVASKPVMIRPVKTNDNVVLVMFFTSYG
jgi:hypothetical protein